MAATIQFAEMIPRLKAKLETLDLSTLSRESGFLKRTPRKADAHDFLLGFFMALSNNCISLMNFAFAIGTLIRQPLSKMAVYKRINTGLFQLLKVLLSLVIADHLKPRPLLIKRDVFSSFNRVFLNDSTTIALPAKLARFFPGPGTHNAKKTATLKLQVFYEALQERFFSFTIGTFRDNDQNASKQILNIANANDLVIRDLGYFVLDTFAQMQHRSIFFLSRLKNGVLIYDQSGQQEIDLVKLLKKHNPLDCQVTVGKQTKLSVRLIALPLPDEVANQRRRKAKKNKDRRLNPNKAHLFLMGFNLFITNVEGQTWTAKEVAQVYRLRWRIEIIFKAWKSHFHLTAVTNPSVTQLKTIIYARLILITIFQHYCFIPLYQILLSTQQKHLSLLKMTVLIQLAISVCMIEKIQLDLQNPSTQLNMLYHGKYESRSKRTHYPEMVTK